MQVYTNSGDNGLAGELNEVILTRKLVQREVYDQYILAAITVVVRRGGPWIVDQGEK